MHEVSWASQLYTFLRYCNRSGLEKVVLDCGAGGDQPPLSMFYDHGCRTFGVEIAPMALEQTVEYCAKSGKTLNVILSDMRHLPFGDQSFSFVYSYNAIFFMTKQDIQRALQEIDRVLRGGGLCFVNFLSVDDADFYDNEMSSIGNEIYGSERFSFHEDGEPDAYFQGYEILQKEKRLLEKLFEGKVLKQAYLDYIVKKL